MPEREAVLELPDSEATQKLGARVAGALENQGGMALLLTGSLGAGKTTFVRGLVTALPGGGEAEVASPSFNIVNVYPTRPPVAHFDLYRLETGLDDDTLWEALDDPETLVVVEWAERLTPAQRSMDALELELAARGGDREAKLAAHGPRATQVLKRFLTTQSR